MDTQVLLVVVIVALVVIGLAAWWYTRRQRTAGLRGRFGAEYDRALSEQGDQHRAESSLEAREQRVQQLDIRPLSSADRDRFAESWRSVQAQFVDDPKGATEEADRLVAEVMQTRGYPIGDFEQRAADISVDHPQVVENYRAAHKVALRNERDEANTEDLRKAMVHYRSLFEELLEAQEARP